MDKAPSSFWIDVRSLPKRGHPVAYEATEAERVALAELNDVLEIRSFKIEALVEKWRSDGIKVGGTVLAEVVQECVVTLQPVTAQLDFPIEATFVREGSKLDAANVAEMIVDPEGDDPPETFDGMKIDVGALASEMFSLALDPYPRVDGAELPNEASDENAVSPFAGLAALKGSLQ